MAWGGGSGSALPGSCAFSAFGDFRSRRSLAVAAGGTIFAGQTRPPTLLFPSITWLDPFRRSSPAQGRSRGGRRLETGRSSGLGPSQLSVAAPGSLPFSRTAGWAESRTRGVGPLWCPLEPPEDCPLCFSLVCPLSPPASLLPGGCGQVSTVAGPTTRDRMVRAHPPPVPTCHPEEKLKSVGGRESDAMKLRPVVFPGVQSGPGPGPRSD